MPKYCAIPTDSDRVVSFTLKFIGPIRKDTSLIGCTHIQTQVQYLYPLPEVATYYPKLLQITSYVTKINLLVATPYI